MVEIGADKQPEPCVLGSATPKSSLVQYIPIFLIPVALSLWNWQVIRHFSAGIVIVFIGLLLVSLAAGDLFLKYTADSLNRFDDFSTRFLCGFFVTNLALFILALIFPFGLALDSLILSLAVCLVWIISKKTKLKSLLHGSSAPETVLVLIALVAVAFWCQDLASPIEENQAYEYTVIKACPDAPFFIRQISIFASAHGLGSISDFQMSGAPVHPYHFGSYIFPATIVAITSISSLEAFASFYVPFGLLLTALASYSLLSSLFGKWPGVASGLILMLAPDAMQQGFGNGYLSYHWLQQNSPALPYGIALAALASLFMLEGCRAGRFNLIATGYFFVICTLFFKAQIFVAISFVILVYPSLFMDGLKIRQRLIYFSVATALYVTSILLSQDIASIPTLRPDGSGLILYAKWILSFQSTGILKNIFSDWLLQAQSSWASSAVVFALMLLSCTFGVFIVIYLGLLVRLRNSFRPFIVFFPILIVLNYLTMSESLALDNKNLGTPDELLHRPFVWAYFVVCTWSGAGLYYAIFGDCFPKRKTSRILVVAATCLAIYIPIYFGKNIQTLPMRSPDQAWSSSFVFIPTCLMKIAQFIRNNSAQNEIIQDSLNDPLVKLSGLSERQAFFIDRNGVASPDGAIDRLRQLQVFKNMVANDDINEFAKQNAIKWYVLNPRDEVKWPDDMEHRKVYKCGNYKMYHFM